jgi:hypothetical protein
MPLRLFKRIVVHHPRPLQRRNNRSEQIKFLFRTQLGRRELNRLTLRLAVESYPWKCSLLGGAMVSARGSIVITNNVDAAVH